MDSKELFLTIVVGIAFLIVYNQFRIVMRMKHLVGKKAPGEGNGDISYDRLRNGMLYFFSPGCMACKAMSPIVDSLKEKYKNIIMIDAGKFTDLAIQFEIMATPTIIFVKNGVIRNVYIGRKKESALISELEKLYSE